MKIKNIEMWKGHHIIVLYVKRWKPIYRYFNQIFARATWKFEMMIDDGSIVGKL